MADVQVEHGYARIARSLLRALARSRFSSLEHAVIWAVIEQTYAQPGSPKTAAVPMSRMAELTGRSRGRCHEAVSALRRRSVLTVEKRGRVLILGLQKDFDAWESQALPSSDRSGRGEQAPIVPDGGNDVVPDGGNNERQDSKTPPSPLRGDPPHGGASTPEQVDPFALENPEAPPDGAPFDRFWSAYPHKVSKASARRAWSRLKLDQRVDQVLAGLDQAKALDRRFRDPEFTPHPATWLNAAGWQDEHAPSNGAGGPDAPGERPRELESPGDRVRRRVAAVRAAAAAAPPRRR